MRNTLFALIGGMTLMFCAVSAISEACVTVSPTGDTYTVDGSGHVNY